VSRVLVLGGSRSGKSAHAESLVADLDDVVYLATSQSDPTDDEWAARIGAHRARRPAGWTTLETTAPSDLLRRGTVLVDSITTWVAALMDQTGVWDEADPAAPGRLARRCDALVDNWVMTPAHVVAVSDEVGLGVVPETRSGRLFRDTLGAVNQRLAATADEVWFVVAGLPQRLR
jgi:adenosylcobinamide kinase / adenosylcobinamide-phosphate guanylyltransferase